MFPSKGFKYQSVQYNILKMTNKRPSLSPTSERSRINQMAAINRISLPIDSRKRYKFEIQI